MVEISVVIDKLHSFETADQLADLFRECGIKAQPRNARACPISQFVAMETGIGVVTNTTSIVFYADEDEAEMSSLYEHTLAMTDFVEMYDMGYYPDLIQEGYEYVVGQQEDEGCPCCL